MTIREVDKAHTNQCLDNTILGVYMEYKKRKVRLVLYNLTPPVSPMLVSFHVCPLSTLPSHISLTLNAEVGLSEPRGQRTNYKLGLLKFIVTAD